MPLDLCVFKRFRVTTSPDTEVVVSNGRVEVKSHVHVLEVTFLGRVSKLPEMEKKLLVLSYVSKVGSRSYLWYQFMTLTPSASRSDR